MIICQQQARTTHSKCKPDFVCCNVLQDSLRCSETGAAFFSDMMSKHAMHACGAEEVLYAGKLPTALSESGFWNALHSISSMASLRCIVTLRKDSVSMIGSCFSTAEACMACFLLLKTRN